MQGYDISDNNSNMTYSNNLPSSIGGMLNLTVDDPSMSDTTADSPRPKKHTRRSVACKNCHGLKVKCTPSDETDPSSPCVRCVNTKKKCEIDLNQPRKRRKKAEIQEARENAKREKHDTSLDYQNAVLGSFPSIRSPNEPFARTASPHTADLSSRRSTNGNDVAKVVQDLELQINQLKTQVEYYRSKSGLADDPGPDYISKADLVQELKILSREGGPSFLNLSNSLKESATLRSEMVFSGQAKTDLISLGFVGEAEAELRLRLYREEIYTKFPYIEVDETMSALELADKHTSLFNSIMAVSNLVIQTYNESHNQRIEIEATRQLIIVILIAGQKSEELLKSLTLLGFWYNTPELVKLRRFHLINALSISMLHDLGIVNRDTEDPSHPPMTDQQRKLVMLLYTSTVAKCLILKRTIYVKWTSCVEQCCRYLETSGDIRLRLLGVFARLNQLLEKIHKVFHSSDAREPDSGMGLYITTELEEQLRVIKTNIPDNQHHILAFFYAVEAYLYEPLVSQVAGANEEDGLLFFKENALTSISKSSKACMNCLREFSSLQADFVATFPLVYTTRMIYTAGILLRLRYLILSVPLRVERSLVPAHVIDIVENTHRVFIEASKAFPANYFLKKTSLMLKLFIHVYAMQVQSLLKSEDHPIRSYEKQPADIEKYILDKSKKNNRIPLDVLSYAASLKQDLSDVNEINKKLKLNSKSNPNSPNNQKGTPESPRGSMNRSNTQMRYIDGVGGLNNGVPSSQIHDQISNQIFAKPEISVNVNQGLGNVNNLVGQGDGDTPNHPSSSASSIVDANALFGANGVQELEKSFYNFGEEFWGDIFNPDSNNFNLEGRSNFHNDVFS